MNLQLQGKNINLAKAKGVVGAFIDKLSIFEENMQRKDLTKFLNLKSSCGGSEDFQTYCLYLQTLKEDLQSRFQDLTSLKVPTWFINSFITTYLVEEGFSFVCILKN
ncbi:unnamed protein product [Diabrotica balteata]|uniref:Uncharacterized protein n=1 Tax=Diabrotica balteata TaxID=107213 RepID=A0A9N9T062_DIABA|nr:unnamed protein product [Diabrotica balteata]